MNRLFIDGAEVDLSEMTTIGMTYQINDLAKLQNRNGNFSNIFKLPINSRNRKVFKSVEVVGSIQDSFSKKYTVDYFENDVQIVFNGVGTLEGVDERFYSFRVNSGNKTFFDDDAEKIVGRLYDGLENYRGELIYWHINDIVGFNSATDYVIFPIVDFKHNFNFLNNPDVYVYSMPLCLFVNDVFTRYAEMKGYKLVGSFIDSDEYKNLLLTPDTLSYNQEIISGIESPIPENNNPWTPYDFYESSFISSFTDNIYQPSGGTSIYTTDHLTATNYFGWFVKNPLYEPSGNYENTIGFKGTLYFSFSGNITTAKDNPFISWITPPNFGIHIYLTNVTTAEVLYYNQAYFGNLDGPITDDFEISGVFFPDHLYQFNLQVVHQASGQDGYTLFTGGTIQLDNVTFENEQTYGAVLFPNRLFNIKIKDLFLDVMNQFCVLSQVNEIKNEINFFFFDDLLKNTALDWSGFVDMNSVQISGNLGNFKNVNNFMYASNEYVKDGYGDGTLTNSSGVGETNIIEMTTSATEEVEATYNSINVPHIKMINDDWTNNAVNNRLLMLDRQNTAFNLLYTDGNTNAMVNTNVPFARFLNKLDFPYLLEEHYHVVREVIENPTVITLRLNLNETVKKELDFSKAIYLNVHNGNVSINGRFYVSKIKPKNIVELIKI